MVPSDDAKSLRNGRGARSRGPPGLGASASRAADARAVTARDRHRTAIEDQPSGSVGANVCTGERRQNEPRGTETGKTLSPGLRDGRPGDI